MNMEDVVAEMYKSASWGRTLMRGYNVLSGKALSRATAKAAKYSNKLGTGASSSVIKKRGALKAKSLYRKTQQATKSIADKQKLYRTSAAAGAAGIGAGYIGSKVL